MTSQGVLAQIDVPHADMACSCEHLKNPSINENITQFIVKCRLQLVETYTHIATCYPEVSRRCRNCNHPSETISHVLNGCRTFLALATKRHNRLVDIIETQVNDHVADAFVYKERMVTSGLIQMDDTTHDNIRDIPHRKLDLLMVNHSINSVTIIEVSCPWDRFLDDCYQLKVNKYLPLCQRISGEGLQCKIVVIIVGSSGLIHKRVRPGLKLLGLPSKVATAAAKYLSVSSMIGSNIIWKSRCRRDFNVSSV